MNNPRLLSTAAIALAMAFGTPSPAQANPVQEPYSDQFNGAFVEYGVRAGLSALPSSGLSGWSLDAGIRHSFPMYLGDTRLAYRYDNLASDDANVAIHGAGLTLGIHPLYLALLSNGFTGHVLASLHLEIGLGAQYALYRADASPELAESDLGFAWSLGAGFDLPLFNPNRGYAPWLNVLYRYRGGHLDLAEGPGISLGTHTAFVGLSWRVNGLLF
ncbi:MAG: hypothetical protein H0U74_05820 [Bradymonadaceae bacterium]|nr:hypothetical protein [Lujinxingiaceae bacterium]